MAEIRAVLYNDLHAVRDDCHTKCEQVVTLADHAAAIKALEDKLDTVRQFCRRELDKGTIGPMDALSDVMRMLEQKP